VNSAELKNDTSVRRGINGRPNPRVWLDIMFVDQLSRDISMELAINQEYFILCTLHVVAASNILIKRGWCLWELWLRAYAMKKSVLVGELELDGADYDFYGQMQLFDPGDRRQIQLAVGRFFQDVSSMNRAIAVQLGQDEQAAAFRGLSPAVGGSRAEIQRQRFSITVPQLMALVKDAQKLQPLARYGDGLNSNHIREFLMARRLHARSVFGKYYVEQSATAALTYEWTLTLIEIIKFVNPHQIRELKERVGDESIPEDMSRFSVWLDVFQLDQNSNDIRGELRKSEAEYKEAKYHMVLATRTLCTRAWCLHEIGTRTSVSKMFYLLRSLNSEGKFDMLAYIQNATGKVFEEMTATKEEDLVLIKERILATYGNARDFNKVVYDACMDAVYS
jgi:hypothetical protein